MKYILLILIFSMAFSCKTTSSQEVNDLKYVDQNLKNITNFPDDYFFPNGDSIYKRILDKGKKITPLLIEKIADTTVSKIVYADTARYRVGDIAINLLDNLYRDDLFPIRKIIEDGFHKNNPNAKETLYIMLYHDTFFLGPDKINYENRKIFQKIVEKWFDNRK